MTDTIPEVGGFQNRSALTIHTRHAQTLCTGKAFDTDKGARYRVPSLHVFGILCNKLWQHARRDDPYADLTLIEIERLVDRATGVLTDLRGRMDKTMADHPLPEGIELAINESTAPSRISLAGAGFHTVHARLLALLIARYDTLMRRLETFHAFGLLKPSLTKQSRYRATRAMRAILMAATTYKALGVSRHDILHKTPQGLAAIEAFGMVSMEVLTGKCRSHYGPTVVIDATSKAEKYLPSTNLPHSMGAAKS